MLQAITHSFHSFVHCTFQFTLFLRSLHTVNKKWKPILPLTIIDYSLLPCNDNVHRLQGSYQIFMVKIPYILSNVIKTVCTNRIARNLNIRTFVNTAIYYIMAIWQYTKAKHSILWFGGIHIWMTALIHADNLTR